MLIIYICWQVGAEFVGTLILIFAGTATAIVNQKTNGSETLLGCAASTGLAVMIVILSTGHISGAHLNPAVTIAFAALKHFPWKHVTQKSQLTLYTLNLFLVFLFVLVVWATRPPCGLVLTHVVSIYHIQFFTAMEPNPVKDNLIN